MKKSIKKFWIVTGAILAVVIIIAAVTIGLLIQRPGAKFLMGYKGVVNTDIVTQTEESFVYEGKIVEYIQFENENSEIDRNIIVFHGVASEINAHPEMIKFSKGLSYATGARVLIPMVGLLVDSAGAKKNDPIGAFAWYYTAMHKHFGTKSYVIGICVAASAVAVALNYVPEEMYPLKYLMCGPLIDGGRLIATYNSAGMQLDYIVKLANLMNPGVRKDYTEQELELVDKSIIASKPGVTNREEMKAILGEKLYWKIENTEISREIITRLDQNKIPHTPAMKDVPIFILHSRNDNIIPFAQGQALYNYMAEQGFNTKFIGVSIIEHTQGINSIIPSIIEVGDLVSFFDDFLN